MPYTVVELEKGSLKWRKWCQQGIVASDASIIMGENPWGKAEDLLKAKSEGNCRGGKCKSGSPMARGKELTPEARKVFEAKTGIRVPPACLQSRRYEWLRSSVDGLSADGNVVVEIKCGPSAYFESVYLQHVPKYYYGQLQHILAVTNLSTIEFFCYWPGNPEFHLRVPYRKPSGSDLDS